MSTSLTASRLRTPVRTILTVGCTLAWFNPLAFTSTPQFVIPNGPRFLPNVRQGFLRNWDLTLNKNIQVNERVSFRLEGKFYNLLNQVTFAGPSAITVNGNNFGSAGGVSSNPRFLEVGGKLSF